jgi:predicted Ser/Thr protein kinase
MPYPGVVSRSEPSTSGRALLEQCPPTTRASLESILALEDGAAPEQDHLPLVRAVVDLVEAELVRVLLDPLRPWAEALAAVTEEKKSGRKAAETLRLWSTGEPIHNVVALASLVFQALRTGHRAGEPRVTTLIEVFFSPALQGRVTKPQLGLALERVRTRFRDPLARESCAFSQSDYEDLVRTVLGVPRVAVWHRAGADPEDEAVLDLLLRGTRQQGHPTPTPPSRDPTPGAGLPGTGARALAETAIEPGPLERALGVEALVGLTGPDVGPDEIAAEVSRAQADPGRRLGQYALLGELGRGGMGVVFRGWDLALDRQVAIKVLKCGADAGPDALERFGREGRAVARLHHENIVVVHEVAERAGQPYLVMQYVEGRTLHDWLAEERTLEDVVRVARSVALALHYAHEHGVIHRDVKPANVMIDARSRPILMDFGLALDLTARTRLTATGQIMGTPTYMAPEQIEGDQAAVGAAADVYALGAVLYRALCGRPPFVASSPTALFKMVLLDEPDPLRSLNPEIPADLEAVVQRCLAKDPTERYPSAAALASALEGCLAG